MYPGLHWHMYSCMVEVLMVSIVILMYTIHTPNISYSHMHLHWSGICNTYILLPCISHTVLCLNAQYCIGTVLSCYMYTVVLKIPAQSWLTITGDCSIILCESRSTGAMPPVRVQVSITSAGAAVRAYTVGTVVWAVAIVYRALIHI